MEHREAFEKARKCIEERMIEKQMESIRKREASRS